MIVIVRIVHLIMDGTNGELVATASVIRILVVMRGGRMATAISVHGTVEGIEAGARAPVTSMTGAHTTGNVIAASEAIGSATAERNVTVTAIMSVIATGRLSAVVVAVNGGSHLLRRTDSISAANEHALLCTLFSYRANVQGTVSAYCSFICVLCDNW